MQTATATATAAAAVTTSRGRCTINFDSFIIFHEIGCLKDIFFVKTFLNVGRWSILPLDLDHQLPSSVNEFSFLLSRNTLEELQDVTNEDVLANRRVGGVLEVHQVTDVETRREQLMGNST